MKFSSLNSGFASSAFLASTFAAPAFAVSSFAPSAFPPFALPASALDDQDLVEQLGLADRADWLLLRLVGCTALATLLLALTVSVVR